MCVSVRMYDVYRGRKVGMCSLLPLCSTTYLPRMYCAKAEKRMPVMTMGHSLASTSKCRPWAAV